MQKCDHLFPFEFRAKLKDFCRRLTGASTGGPGWQAAGSSAAVESADILGGQQLREECPLESIRLSAQHGRGLGGDVHHLPREEGHSNRERVLYRRRNRGQNNVWMGLRPVSLVLVDTDCSLVPTVFWSVYSEVMLSSSSVVKAERSRLQPWLSSTLHWW